VTDDYRSFSVLVAPTRHAHRDVHVAESGAGRQSWSGKAKPVSRSVREGLVSGSIRGTASLFEVVWRVVFENAFLF